MPKGEVEIARHQFYDLNDNYLLHYDIVIILVLDKVKRILNLISILFNSKKIFGPLINVIVISNIYHGNQIKISIM